MLKALMQMLPIAGLLLFAAAPARAADEKQVKNASDKAVVYLKSMAGGGNGINDGGHGEGPAALAGIAMLEYGVGRSDPAIQAIARQIRAAAIPQNKTYQLSLDIIFLDKLGEEIDSILIQSMAARLLWGQTRNGGWGYHCPELLDAEKNRLQTLLQGAKLNDGKGEPIGSVDPSGRPKLDPVIAEMIQKGTGLGPIPGAAGGAPPPEDNSNTQFATIALWSARKHSVPVDPQFENINKRFRASQNPQDGGWTYAFGGYPMSTPSMTCAGLLGLAVVKGVRSERSMRSKGRFSGNKFEKGSTEGAAVPDTPNYRNDQAIMNGLTYLGNALNAATGKGPAKQVAPNPNRPPMAPGLPGGNLGMPPAMMQQAPGSDLREDFYFLWSLERVCMVFGLDKIGNVDWHDWGAQYLLAKQLPNGSWMTHKYPGVIDTSFALMFLNRSNIVRDLSKMMERTIKTGGDPKVAGQGAKKPDGKPAAPEPSGDAEVVKLVQEFMKAGAAKQLSLLEEYEREKGVKYTLALGDIIPQVKDDIKTKAREALANRMARLSAKTLTAYMDVDNPELSRAACLAVAMRDERSLIPELIKHLDDTDEIVWRAAAIALREISGGKDFGPKKGATDAQRDKAIAEWKAWYEKEQKAEKGSENVNKK